jgi:hypothetical protein
MSGPKVVRIVTRQEIEAICRRHLAAVEAAAEDLRRTARRLGMFDDSLERSLEDRHRRLSNLFAANRVLDLQKQAPKEVVFLRAETDRLQERAAEAAAVARMRQRQLTDAVRSVVAALEGAGLAVPIALQNASRGRLVGGETALVEREIAAAARQLASLGQQAPNPEIDALAGRLKEGVPAQTVDEWLARRPTPPDPAQVRLDRLLADISTLEVEAASVFERRVAEISGEQDASRRSLLTDSLMLDLSAHVTKLRAQEEFRRRLGQVVAVLSQSTSKESSALRDRVQGGWERPSEDVVGRLEAEAEALIASESQVLAAAERRRVILSGLSALGYEVGAQMETARIREGRVVVRRPGTSDYGIELGAPADAARMQVRLVGSDQPSAPRDAGRDADQETVWCSDFDRLRATLSASGSEIVLERALEAGVQPVKTVSMPAPVIEEAVRARAPIARTSRP